MIKKVLVFGTFDGLHEGHLSFFKQARKHGDYLVAVAGRDVNIKKIKKRLPKNKEQQRLEKLEKCKLVNEARLGYKDNPYRIIKEIKPDVICLGYDQLYFTVGLEKKLKELKLETKIYKLKSYKPEQFKSSIINKK